jgi:hypothetical protein
MSLAVAPQERPDQTQDRGFAGAADCSLSFLKQETRSIYQFVESARAMFGATLPYERSGSFSERSEGFTKAASSRSSAAIGPVQPDPGAD